MSELELEKEFKKFRLEETPFIIIEDTSLKTSTTCTCPTQIRPSLLEVSNSNKMKIKDRRGHSLIRPARLKVIGNCYAKKFKCSNEKTEDTNINLVENVDDFTSEAFLKMRISSASNESPSHLESPPELIDRDEKLLPSTSSSSLNCSTQAKLQQQIPSTEFDSTIDEMSDFLAYHLSLFNHRDKYLIDSMYT